METAKQAAVVAAAMLAGWLINMAVPKKPEPAHEVTPVSAEPADNAAKCGPDCECLPPCTCERGGECLQDEPSEPPKAVEAAPAKAEPPPGLLKTCPVCKGEGYLRTYPGLQRCSVCGGDGVIDDDPRDPEFQPQPTSTPAKAQDLVAVQQPTYRRGLFGRQRFTGYRTVTMTREQAAKPQATYYGGGCANGRCGR